MGSNLIFEQQIAFQFGNSSSGIFEIAEFDLKLVRNPKYTGP